MLPKNQLQAILLAYRLIISIHRWRPTGKLHVNWSTTWNTSIPHLLSYETAYNSLQVRKIWCQTNEQYWISSVNEYVRGSTRVNKVQRSAKLNGWKQLALRVTELMESSSDAPSLEMVHTGIRESFELSFRNVQHIFFKSDLETWWNAKRVASMLLLKSGSGKLMRYNSRKRNEALSVRPVSFGNLFAWKA